MSDIECVDDLKKGLEPIDFRPVYTNPTPGQIPILGLPFSNYSTPIKGEYDFDDFLDLGIALTSKPLGVDAIIPILSEANGKVRLYINNGYLNASEYEKSLMEENMGKFISDKLKKLKDNYFGDPKTMLGINLGDEPNIRRLLCCRHNSLLNRYKVLHRYFVQKAPWMMTHINLVGIAAFDSEEDFQKYLDVYGTYYKPPYWSFDCYPVMRHNPLLNLNGFISNYGGLYPGETLQCHEYFYRNLEMVSAKARECGRPFWSYLMSTEHILGGTNGYFPAPLENHLRFEAFSALAYGAQGLCHWRYLQGKDSTNPKDEIYMDALRNLDGSRTPGWYFAQRINAEIQKYAYVFLGSSVKGVFHTHIDRMVKLQKRTRINLANAYKESNKPEGEKVETIIEREMAKINPFVTESYRRDKDKNRVPTGYKQDWGLTTLTPTSIPAIKSIESESESDLGVMVSYITNNSKVPGNSESLIEKSSPIIPGSDYRDHYIIIVNHDISNYQTISINLNKYYQLDELTPLKSGESAPTQKVDWLNNATIKRTLLPGGYLIFHWTL
ncbi:MAG: hypothetical protein K2G67_06290 [Muribaculaceae bacterium]|nr:hypothetical protein [Muribaculaceae bacterium]